MKQQVVSGLYWLPTEYILVDVGMPVPDAEGAIQELIGLGMISRHGGWLFVHGMIKYQSSSPKIEKAIQSAFEKCESDVLRKIFFDRQKSKGWQWLKKEDLADKKEDSIPYPVQDKDKDKDKNQDQDQDRTSCAARSEADLATPPVPEDADPVFETAPLNDGTRFKIRQSHIDRLSSLYPMVDVIEEIRLAVAWSETNPKHRKTRGGYMRHLNQWLGKAQNQSRPKAAAFPARSNGAERTTPAQFGRAINDAIDRLHPEQEVIEHE